MKKIFTTTLKLLTLIAFSGGLLWLILAMISPDKPRTETPKPAAATPAYVYTPKQDPYLFGILKTVAKSNNGEVNVDDVAIYYQEEPLEAGQNFNGITNPLLDDEGKPHYKIRIRPGIDETKLKGTIAHEYLHVVWQTRYKIGKSNPELDTLASELEKLTNSDPAMQRRMVAYEDNVVYDKNQERFSIYCVESSDRYLSQYVLNECNKYIHRELLQFQR